MEPCAKYQKTQAGARGGNKYKIDIVFTIKDVPDYQILAHAHVEETPKWGEKDLCTALTDHVPGVWAFQVTEKDKRECVFRVELPSAHDDAAAIKELTGGDWTIKTEKIGFCNIKLTASDFAGVDLRSMSVVGPRVLRACRLGGRRPPKKLFGQVFALSHVVESIAHSAIATPKDAGRLAMVDKESLVGAVRQWTLTPLVETIKAPCSPGGPMVGVEQRTGLARALGVEDLVTTPTDTAALAALFRAAVRPPAAARESMRRAHVEEDYVPKTQDGLAEVKRTRALSVSAVKFRGVSLITFAWVRFTVTEDDATKEDFGALYILRRNDPTFRLVLQHDPKARAALHLERFLGLRVSLAAVDPAIDRVADATLLALLMVVLGGPARTVAARFATVAMMKHHPERPPGHGQDYHYHRVSSEIEGLATPRPDRWAGAPIVRGLLVPSNEGDRARPAAVRAMRAIDALHASSA